MIPIKTEVIYEGKITSQYIIKDYFVSENKGKWFCTCSIKYKRNPLIECKHIFITKKFIQNERNDKQ